MGSSNTVLKIVDPLLVAVTAVLSYWIRFGDIDLPAIYQGVVLGAFGLAVLVFAVTDVYRGSPIEALGRTLVQLFAAWAGIFGIVVALIYGTQTGLYFSRQWLGVWSVLALVSMIAVRFVFVGAVRSLYARGRFIRRVAIVGAGSLGRQVVQRLGNTAQTGLRVVGFYDDDPALAGRTVDGVAVCGDVAAVRQAVEAGIDQVWIALPLSAGDRVRGLMNDLARYTVHVRFVPDIFSFRLLNHSVAEIGGLPVIKITEAPLSGAKYAVKWVEDKVIALLILGVLWPLLIAICVGVKLSSPGPVIFRQRRAGLDNREIEVWKFRTMYVHDESTAQRQAVPDDPRVTPFGRFLRRTSLDELPQFVNVLTGSMSVVGPRPHAIWMHNDYANRMPRYLLRSWIKPGITGWAQICGWRGELSEDWKMEMRIQHDLYYLENWSLAFDLYIILMTPFKMRGERAY